MTYYMSLDVDYTLHEVNFNESTLVHCITYLNLPTALIWTVYKVRFLFY